MPLTPSHRPLMTRAIGLVMVLAYLASAAVSGSLWDLSATDLLRLGGTHGPAIAAGEPWRLASAIFLHGGLLHLSFNLIALLDIGGALERRFGGIALACVFLASGVAGFLASALWQPDDVSIGASGAIFGLLGWWAVAAWKLSEFLPTGDRRRRLLTLLLIVGVALGLGFLLPGIDNAAHLGGLLVGTALAAATLARPRALPWLALGVILAVWGGSKLLPAESAETFRETRDFAALYSLFAKEDQAISESLVALGEDSRNGRISDQQARAILEQSVLPRLAAQFHRLDANHFGSPRVERVRRHWVRYAELRLQAVEAIHGAATGRMPDGVARFEQLTREAAQMAQHPPGSHLP